MNILIALLLLGVIIFIHELGHYMAAKFFKMPVSEFAIGMGPKLYSYYNGKTSYSLRIIPFGGFVSIDGMEVGSEVENGFNNKKPFARFIVLSAGVFMNFLLALIIILGILFSTGKRVSNKKPVIGNVLEQSLAVNIVKKDDIIKKINDIKIINWNDIAKVVQKIPKEESKISVIIERNQEEMKLELPLTKVKEKYIIGIEPKYTIEKFGIIDGGLESFKIFGNIFSNILGGFKSLILGEVKAKDVSGPIGIIKVVGEASKDKNIVSLMWLLVFLSINVGIFNLLPFPALDGGRILFIIFELVGIKVNKKLEERLHAIGIGILLILIMIITVSDISKLFKN